MSGYTPVFGEQVFSGSLCGKFPDSAAWMFLLALADRHGVVDKTPQYIASITGMPLELLLPCLERFQQPDPMSRTQDHEGRRLELVDSSRPWGWRVINFAKYREKARLLSKTSAEVSSGRNAARMKDRRSPPPTAADHPSDSDSDSDSNSYLDLHTKEEREQPQAADAHAPVAHKNNIRSKSRGTRLPDDFGLTRERIAFACDRDVTFPDDEMEKFRNYWSAIPGSRGVKCDWDAVWRNWILKEAKNVAQKKANVERLYGGSATASSVRHFPLTQLRTADEIEAEERARGDHG